MQFSKLNRNVKQHNRNSSVKKSIYHAIFKCLRKHKLLTWNGSERKQCKKNMQAFKASREASSAYLEQWLLFLKPEEREEYGGRRLSRDSEK